MGLFGHPLFLWLPERASFVWFFRGNFFDGSSLFFVVAPTHLPLLHFSRVVLFSFAQVL